MHAATATGSGASPTWTAAYDAAGEMTCRAPSGSTTCSGTQTGAQLSWDAEGRLASWQNTPSSPTTDAYLYDGEGTRVAQQVNQSGGSGSLTTTTYIGNIEEVATTNGVPLTTTSYYYAGSQRIALAVNGTFSYLGNDSLTSATVALASTGTPQASQLFDPYGTVRYSSGAMPGSYAYAGQRADGATGLSYDVARSYDPLAGQFTSADTVLPGNGYDVWGLSRYAYVAGNPETHVDADGHCWPLCTMLIGAVVGAAIGAATSIVSQATSGQGVNWGEVGKQAAVGAVSGAISGLAGPEFGPLARAAVDTAASVGGQVLSNALEGKALGDGVLHAAANGAAMSVEMGAAGALLAKGAGRFFGAVAQDAEEEAGGALEAAMGGEGGEGGTVSCPFSFTPDTAVATPSGEVPIAQLQVGDQVLAYDPTTGTTRPQTVQQVWITHDTDLLDLHLKFPRFRGQCSVRRQPVLW